jgi:small subunit ribosomal protein S1
MADQNEDEDFAALFAASGQAKQYERGQTVEGRIVAIGPEVAFVDIGGKGEATLDVAELKDADGVMDAAVGDRIQAVVVSTAGGLTLSRRLVRGAATDRHITEAYESGLPVEGKVEREVKGGYEIRVGRQRGFCPISQIDVARTTDPAVHVGHVYTFRIIEYRNDGRDLVLSRRALLEAEQREAADAVRRAAVPGAVVRGRVASVRDFGVFVDLGAGVQGLLHVSDIGWSRVTDTAQMPAVGDEITVKVLRVDEATQKIALGLKQLSEDPWLLVPSTYQVGQVRSGRVTRVAEFGAFVELAPGIEGLAHASSFAPTGKAGSWKDTVPVGTTGTFEVIDIDPQKRRIGLALVDRASSEEAAELRDYQERSASSEARPTGTLGDKLRGALESPRRRR